MTDPENVITRRSQHPVIRGMVCGAVSVVVTAFFIGFVPPAYAFSIPVGDLFVINLGDLPPWIGVAVAFGVWWDARKAKKHAADAVAATHALAEDVKLVERNTNSMTATIERLARKEGNVEGEAKGVAAGEATAKTFAQGQQTGREIERERVKAAPLAAGESPVPVVDDVAGGAAVKSAAALESLASSAKKTAEEKKKD